jgi:F-type H+-transporting ATPase subunit delta
MAEKSTIARPYAKAIFQIAMAEKGLRKWSEMLAAAALIVADARMQKALSSPHMRSEAVDLINDLLGERLDEKGRNLLATLAANRRLTYLPEIAAIFHQLKADAENTVDVKVTTAVALDSSQQQQFASALRRRLNRDIRLHCELDPKVLGGAVLSAGDLVIDGSLRGRLERLTTAIAGQ